MPPQKVGWTEPRPVPLGFYVGDGLSIDEERRRREALQGVLTVSRHELARGGVRESDASDVSKAAEFERRRSRPVARNLLQGDAWLRP